MCFIDMTVWGRPTLQKTYNSSCFLTSWNSPPDLHYHVHGVQFGPSLTRAPDLFVWRELTTPSNYRIHTREDILRNHIRERTLQNIYYIYVHYGKPVMEWRIRVYIHILQNLYVYMYIYCRMYTYIYIMYIYVTLCSLPYSCTGIWIS